MYFVPSISIEHFKFGFRFSAPVDLEKALVVCRTILSYCVNNKQLQIPISCGFRRFEKKIKYLY